MKGWPSLTFENGKGCGSLIRGGKPTMKVGPNCIGKAKGPSSVTKRGTVEIGSDGQRVLGRDFPTIKLRICQFSLVRLSLSVYDHK